MEAFDFTRAPGSGSQGWRCGVGIGLVFIV